MQRNIRGNSSSVILYAAKAEILIRISMIYEFQFLDRFKYSIEERIYQKNVFPEYISYFIIFTLMLKIQ